ncbi:hypothetical protein TVAG_080820 [Trichomonas vaginalis G3]|uniref:Uncharacterized protein n=1 Tax=Trichomonas vaginalis (strain ATCC PRA-98 / G3) TaxID=412133 RepID=A2EPA5_TRIV3|nr:hypothetical protein TVAGG3_0679430 [Trichomonas vaginalis G3]EAY05490.1 hypothetical protein TVAG_080820 [Trichomonas vaginalis G3]KAI5507793.1 hypothetical protein TVAGG3_0679430 [Trichomonas vaginalis G3]|eukprot:XP_001317713.1 hypothetical protein [Trichomonas vaginalis G3]
MEKFTVSTEMEIVNAIQNALEGNRNISSLTDLPLEALNKIQNYLIKLGHLIVEKKIEYKSFYELRMEEIERVLSQQAITNEQPSATASQPISLSAHHPIVEKTNSKTTLAVPSPKRDTLSFSRQNSRTEVGNRQHVKSTKTETQNLDDIWIKTEKNEIFKRLPENIGYKLDIMFDDMLTKTHSPISRGPHWTEKFKFLFQKGRQTKRTRQKVNPKMPPTPMNMNDISPFWNEYFPKFQVEKTQKCQRSKIHCLLSCIVQCDPPSNTNKTPRRKKTNPLAPNIPYHNYLQLPYEDRLELELKSLELYPQTETENAFQGNLPATINKYEEELTEIRTELKAFQKDLIEKIPEIRKKEEDRYRNIQEINLFLDSLPPK